MNKRILDLLAAFSGVLAIFAGLPYEKDVLQILPPNWTPYIVQIGVVATILLKVLAFLAPPTPSLLPPPEKKEGDSGKIASLQIFLVLGCLSLSACSSWTPEQRAEVTKLTKLGLQIAYAKEIGADNKSVIKLINQSIE